MRFDESAKARWLNRLTSSVYIFNSAFKPKKFEMALIRHLYFPYIPDTISVDIHQCVVGTFGSLIDLMYMFWPATSLET